MNNESAGYTRREVLGLGMAAGAVALTGNLTEAIAAEIPPYVQYLPNSHYIHYGPSGRRNVAITIDDFFGAGSMLYLDQALDLAKTHHAHYTLFPVGGAQLANYRARPNLTRQVWRRALAEGHIVGNHTYDHRLLGSMATSHILWELAKQQSAMNYVLGKPNREYLMRPPGGDGGFPSISSEFNHTLRAVKAAGYYMTMWTVDSNTRSGQVVTANEDNRFLYKIFHDPYEHVRNGSVILVHPTTLSINGLHRLLHGLHSRNYRTVSVPELFMPPNTR